MHLQIVSVLLSCGGIALFAYAEGFQPVGVKGVLLSLVSAIGIAIYKVSETFYCNGSLIAITNCVSLLLLPICVH